MDDTQKDNRTFKRRVVVSPCPKCGGYSEVSRPTEDEPYRMVTCDVCDGWSNLTLEQVAENFHFLYDRRNNDIPINDTAKKLFVLKSRIRDVMFERYQGDPHTTLLLAGIIQELELVMDDLGTSDE